MCTRCLYFLEVARVAVAIWIGYAQPPPGAATEEGMCKCSTVSVSTPHKKHNNILSMALSEQI